MTATASGIQQPSADGNCQRHPQRIEDDIDGIRSKFHKAYLLSIQGQKQKAATDLRVTLIEETRSMWNW